MYFLPAHIASEALKYKSKLSSWEVEVIDPTYTLSQLARIFHESLAATTKLGTRLRD
ncbi:MAG: hypothetical protein JSV14_17365 [Deltaproteobacteria bacterium]|nr:MAG: hypothetical protein JSV14_17365 [Deltaproteobacteria bacterium]